jgi:micrococcal nuclease
MITKKNWGSRNNFFARIINLIFVLLIIFAFVLFNKNQNNSNINFEKNSNYLDTYINFIKENNLKEIDPKIIKQNLKYFEKVKFYKVIDGDTIKVINLNDNKEYKVRLIGVDTPESSYNEKLKRDIKRTNKDENSIISLGLKAKEYTDQILKDQEYLYLEYDVSKYDRYNRILAYVYLESGCMLNLILVLNGYAKVYTIPPNVKYSEIFLKAQSFSRTNNLGLYKYGF